MRSLGMLVLALLSREKTGKGQYVESSLLDTVVSLSNYLGQGVLANGKARDAMDQHIQL